LGQAPGVPEVGMQVLPVSLVVLTVVPEEHHTVQGQAPDVPDGDEHTLPVCVCVCVCVCVSALGSR